MQALEQPLAVQPQIHLIGVDHDVVKESVHRRAQHGQGLQRRREIARFELGIGFRNVALQRRVQVLLRPLLQQLGVDVRVDRPFGLGLLEDVAHTFVGRR